MSNSIRGLNILSKTFCLMSLVILAGCAASRGTINSFYEPSYMQGSVNLLAIPTIRNARLAPSESQQIGRSVNRAIAEKNPTVKMMSANKFSNLLNDSGLVDSYADFIEDYITSGIANREFLENLRNNDIDAIMISELSNAYRADGSLGYNLGETRVTISFTIIDTKTNDVIWTAIADGKKGTASTLGDAPPLIEAINLAVEKIVGAVPTL